MLSLNTFVQKFNRNKKKYTAAVNSLGDHFINNIKMTNRENVTFLRFHVFNIIYINLGSFCGTVHSEGRRFRSPKLIFPAGSYAFVLFRVGSTIFPVYYKILHVTIYIIRIIFGAGVGSQFDKMLTRDAPNVCCFLNPL